MHLDSLVDFCLIYAFIELRRSYLQDVLVEFVASRVCVQALPDAPSRPGAPSGTDPKDNFWTLLRGLAPITVRSAHFLIPIPFLSLPLSYCRHVLLTVRLILVRPIYCMRALFSLSRDAPYNSKRDHY